MGIHHLHRRKLIPEICELICHGKDFVSCSSQTDCDVCFKICLTNPQYPYIIHPPPPPPPKIPPSFYLDDEDEDHQHKISTYLIITLSLLAAMFFLVCCRVIYTKLRSRRRTTTISTTQQREETHDDFLDEEQGPTEIVDHPIWYIRTQGLQQSVINGITICKYKKGEGLIEGTECSVCLSEFQDDESLRLLPKCHHAFHLPCIDTWLRSHTNCPMCRAPIVANPSIARIPSLDSIVVDSSSSRMENSGGGLENTTTTTTTTSNGSDSELRNSVVEERDLEIEEAAFVRPRRSVSLDDSLVGIGNINLGIANVGSGESSGGDSDRVLKVIGNENLATTSNSKGSYSFRSTRYLKGVPSPMKRSRSYNGKYLLSWYSRSQRKPNASLNKMHM